MNILSVFKSEFTKSYGLCSYKVKYNLNPGFFANSFKGIHPKYPTREKKKQYDLYFCFFAN